MVYSGLPGLRQRHAENRGVRYKINRPELQRLLNVDRFRAKFGERNETLRRPVSAVTCLIHCNISPSPFASFLKSNSGNHSIKECKIIENTRNMGQSPT